MIINWFVNVISLQKVMHHKVTNSKPPYLPPPLKNVKTLILSEKMGGRKSLTFSDHCRRVYKNPKDFIMVNRAQRERSDRVPGRDREENVCREVDILVAS
jgi:hypothetical protein